VLLEEEMLSVKKENGDDNDDENDVVVVVGMEESCGIPSQDENVEFGDDDNDNDNDDDDDSNQTKRVDVRKMKRNKRDDTTTGTLLLGDSMVRLVKVKPGRLC
jgi:hypothetical protein